MVFLIAIASGKNPAFISKVRLTPVPLVRLSQGVTGF